MTTLPFSISPEAVTRIAHLLKIGQESPHCVGLVPVLYFAHDYQKRDQEGRVFERCPSPYFNIGWDHTEKVIAEGCMKTEVLGLPLFIEADALHILEGKELVLQTVEVGYPQPAERTAQLLRVHPDERLEEPDQKRLP
jgi:hypothetical protein